MLTFFSQGFLKVFLKVFLRFSTVFSLERGVLAGRKKATITPIELHDAVEALGLTRYSVQENGGRAEANGGAEAMEIAQSFLFSPPVGLWGC